MEENKNGETARKEEKKGGTARKEENQNPGVQEYNTDFMKEEIRQRPVNRKRLARRTLITVLMAILFGAIACLVFILLEPVINNAINPVEEVAEVSFPEDDLTQEMSPEDMIVDDQQIQEAAAEEIAASSVESITQEVLEEVQSQLEQEVQKQLEDTAQTLGEQETELSEIYEEFVAAMKETVESVEKSVVTVTAITPGYDWVGDAYDSAGSVSGLIIAERGTELLILADNVNLTQADELLVTFHDGTQTTARIACLDPITDLAVLSVSESDLGSTPEENEEIAVCTLGNSSSGELNGSVIIAVGSPFGSQGSVSYGIITNSELSLDIADGAFRQITTDIYGSTSASGILADTSGRVLGWIDMDNNSSDSPNLISAIGISEMKGLVENMSNEVNMGYLGIHGTDVPSSVEEEQGIPRGSYVLRTELDSPAMDAGIQSGDVIVSLNGNEITSHDETVEILEQTVSGKYLSVTVMRRSQDDWQEVDLTVQLTDRFEMSS